MPELGKTQENEKWTLVSVTVCKHSHEVRCTLYIAVLSIKKDF
jgi:hypothetical protein